jgi:AraC-like DNA-binding protein
MLTRQLLADLKLSVYSLELGCCREWWCFRNVCNPYNRLYLGLDGDAYVTHHGRRYHLKQDSLHLIPCWTQVDMECPKFFDVYYIHFTSRLAGGLDLFSVLECDYDIPASPLECQRFEHLLQLNPDAGLTDYDPFKPAEDTSRLPTDLSIAGRAVGDCIETDALVRMLLIPFVRTARETPSSRMDDLRSLQPILHWIEDHLEEPITLTGLAAQAHLHPTYFSDQFQRVLGIRPIVYINQRRIELARAMLLSTSKSVKRIASEAGFHSLSYFCHTFKKYCGQPPGAYRRTQGQ